MIRVQLIGNLISAVTSQHFGVVSDASSSRMMTQSTDTAAAAVAVIGWRRCGDVCVFKKRRSMALHLFHQPVRSHLARLWSNEVIRRDRGSARLPLISNI